MTRPIDSPGLSIDLSDGTIDGSAEPGRAVELILRRDGGPIARHEFVAPRGGAFRIAFERPGGGRLLTQPGDILLMRIEDSPSRDAETRLQIPVMTIEHDVDTDLVWGDVTPEGRLELWADQAIPRADDGAWSGEARIDAGPDGRYTVAFENEDFDIRPGTAFFGWLQLPSGHFATSSRVVPMVNAQLGGATACGWADGASSEVSAAVDAPDGAPERHGRGSAFSALDTLYSIHLKDAEGRPRTLGPHDRLRADLSGTTADIVLPPLSLELDEGADLLRVTTAPSTEVTVSWPFGACGGSYLEQPWDGTAFESDASGRLELPLSSLLAQATAVGAAVGSTIEVAVFEPGGHRFFAPIHPLMLDVHLGTPRVTGSVGAGSRVFLRLIAADGAERASATTVTRDDGSIDALLITPEGELVSSRSGETLEVTVDDGALRTTLDLLPLSFDFDVGTGLVGRTTPGRQVMATIRLARVGARPETEIDFVIDADSEGRFALDDPPPRSEWTFRDVAEIRLSIALGDGHRIVSTFTRHPDFGPGSPVFLPWAWGGR